MRNKAFTIIAGLILMFGLASFAIPVQDVQAVIDGHLRVVSPNGGETYTVGDTVTIRWDASENIDKIMLGYSSGPGNLNWIATSIPNTGSYTWKVNVGNTTNTKFQIDITGYETGAGSLTDRSDGYFTVNPVEEPEPDPEPATPDPEPTVTDPEPTTTEPIVETTDEPTNETEDTQDTANPQETLIISITEIEINQWFYFEGSKSTDLSTIDPTNVENFTLDRMDLCYFSFIGTADLSGDDASKAFQNLDNNIHMDTYYFWFSWEIWILFETDVEVTFYNKEQSLPANAPVTLNGQELKEDEYTVKTADTGEKTVTVKPAVVEKYVDEGEKIEIGVQQTLDVNFKDSEELTSEDGIFELEGSVSDPASTVYVTLNGEKMELDVDEEGKFKKALDLQEGNNEVTVEAYEKDNDKAYASISGKIIYEILGEEEASSSGPVVLIIAIIAILIAAIGGAIWYFMQKKKE